VLGYKGTGFLTLQKLQVDFLIWFFVCFVSVLGKSYIFFIDFYLTTNSSLLYSFYIVIFVNNYFLILYSIKNNIY